MVWIKICGITNENDAENISEMRPDAIGFVFCKDSPRKISLDGAANILKALRKKENDIEQGSLNCSLSGVFVNENIDKVIKTAEKLNLDYLQFSGNENHDYLLKIKEKIIKINKNKKNHGESNLKIIKSVKIKENKTQLNSKAIFAEINSLIHLVDYILLDHYSEKTYGGTGKTFKWEAIKDIGLFFPVILSGGLDIKNVIGAIEIIKPFGVDASSKLEVSPGKKNIIKVKDFIETVRKWNRDEK